MRIKVVFLQDKDDFIHVRLKVTNVTETFRPMRMECAIIAIFAQQALQSLLFLLVELCHRNIPFIPFMVNACLLPSPYSLLANRLGARLGALVLIHHLQFAKPQSHWSLACSEHTT
jgi:hypothetical protein